jgi:alcohol dehydrogenase class IV
MKMPIVDHRTLPLAAALDPDIMKGMPPYITAATGMDALTHAIEAYLATTANRKTDLYARSAVSMIFENLPKVYHKGNDLKAREQMALASFNAGFAFTQTLVGYVHGIAHQLGSQYGTPHGLANSLVLPHVLEFSKDAVEQRLAELAKEIGLGKKSTSTEALAQLFIDAVYALRKEVGIPDTLKDLQEKDIPALAKAALKETHSSYSVPKYMNQQECEQLIVKLLP